MTLLSNICINSNRKKKMNNLYILINQLTNGYNESWFIILPILAIFTGISVIVCKNPIISVLFLIGLFLNIACILVLLGLNFLGLSYLLVYVGAVSILFLFILMLINIRSSDLTSSTRNSIPLAVIISILFISISQKLIFSKSFTDLKTTYNKYLETKDMLTGLKSLSIENNNSVYIEDNTYKSLTESFDINNILHVSDVSWDKSIMEFSHISSIGNIIYTNYCMWLILTSLILLLAMVGAIVITIKPAQAKN